MKFKNIALRNLVVPSERAEEPISGKKYRQIGVRLWGNGAYERDSIDGSETKYKKLFQVESGDIILNKIWARNGSVAVVSDNLSGCYCSTEFPVYKTLKDKLHPRWFHWITKMRWFWEKCDEQSMGTSGKNRIRPEKFLSIEIPVPSVGDQKQLVTWIDNTADKIQEAQIILENSQILLGKLRQAILQEAVQGKLVPQDRADESATELLKRIKAEKERLIREEEIKKEKPLPPISPDEVPYELPKGWVWVRIGEVMDLINGKAFKPTEWSKAGLRIIRIQNLNDPKAPFNYCNFRVDNKYYVKDFDLLIGWSGTPGTSFGAFIWNRGNAVLNQHIFKAEILGHYIDRDYLRIAINSRLEEMISKSRGGVGLKHINKGKFEHMLIPISPLQTQKRIVTKVDELMKLCDELEEQIRQSKEESEKLMQAVLQEAFEGKHVEESNAEMSVA